MPTAIEPCTLQQSIQTGYRLSLHSISTLIQHLSLIYFNWALSGVYRGRLVYILYSWSHCH